MAIRAAIRHVPPRGQGIRLAHAWTRQHPPGPDVLVSREPGGARLHCDLRDELSRVLFYRGWMDSSLEYWMRGWLHAGDLYVDVGAHIGYLAALAARAVGPTGRVVAFEPATSTHQKLAAAFRGPRFAHVETVNAVVAAKHGETMFHTATGQWAHQAYRSSVHPAAGLAASGVVRTVALDDVFPEGRIRLLKVDVEGGELAVIQGARQLLDERRCDALVVELNPSALSRAGASIESLVSAIGRSGYAPHRICDDGTVEAGQPLDLDREFVDTVFLPGRATTP